MTDECAAATYDAIDISTAECCLDFWVLWH